MVLTGTVDWVDKSGVLWDWKNPGREYQAWEKKRWDIQSHAYSWALDATEFNFGVMANGKLQIIEIERTEELFWNCAGRWYRQSCRTLRLGRRTGRAGIALLYGVLSGRQANAEVNTSERIPGREKGKR